MDDSLLNFNTRKGHPETCTTAVLLIDLQEYFRPLIQPILPELMRVIQLCRDLPIPLFFTRHGHEQGDKGALGDWWPDLIMKGSLESELLPELNILPDETVIEKSRYSAFYCTDLQERLAAHHITDLVIGGVMTNLCCETTARDAFVRDFRIFFLADGTSTANTEFQTATLRNLGYGFAVLLNCRDFIEYMSTNKPC